MGAKGSAVNEEDNYEEDDYEENGGNDDYEF